MFLRGWAVTPSFGVVECPIQPDPDPDRIHRSIYRSIDPPADDVDIERPGWSPHRRSWNRRRQTIIIIKKGGDTGGLAANGDSLPLLMADERLGPGASDSGILGLRI
ncbi:hypothetical protein V8E54_014971 [Elaphomyces granulatus]